MGISFEFIRTAAVFALTFFMTRAIMKCRYQRKKKYTGNLPPGLPSIPFLGSLPFLPQSDRMHLFFMQKAEEFGQAFSVVFGDRYTVIISGREAIHEAFIKQSFASRALHYTLAIVNPKGKGIIDHAYDAEFRKYHQLSLNILKKFGFGKGIIENRIHIEVDDLLSHVKKLNGLAFNPRQLIAGSVSNIIMSIVLGVRYEHSDPVLEKLITDANEFLSLSLNLAIVTFYPKTRFIPKYGRSLSRCVEIHNEILQFMDSKIDAGLQGDMPESFVSHFLELEGQEFDRMQLQYTMRDLYIAGSETSTTVLLWSLVLLANHKEIQDRLHKEIDSVVPRDQLPSVNDKQKLPFVEAVILEILRFKTVAPLGVPHETLEDTQLNGYFIPQGSMVMANLYGVHMDPKVWTDPDVFNPDRFLDENGEVVKRDAVIPFALGKRSCLGELLARQEIFLFLTGLLQNFRIEPPEGQEKIVCQEVIGVTVAPTEYQVRLISRLG